MIAPPAPPAPAPAPAASQTVVVVAKPTRPVGEAVIRCGVTPTGALKGCEVASENPAGVGLGESALRMAARFQVAPPGRSGATTLLPFKFQMASEEKPATPAPSRAPRP